LDNNKTLFGDNKNNLFDNNNNYYLKIVTHYLKRIKIAYLIIIINHYFEIMKRYLEKIIIIYPIVIRNLYLKKLNHSLMIIKIVLYDNLLFQNNKNLLIDSTTILTKEHKAFEEYINCKEKDEKNEEN